MRARVRRGTGGAPGAGMESSERPAATVRTPFDQAAKQLFVRAARRVARVETQLEVLPEVHAVDVHVYAASERSADSEGLGLLGRLFAEEALVEAFHRAPSTWDLRVCLLKQIAFDERRVREDERAERRAVRLWILAGGTPVTALAELGARPTREVDPTAGWPEGVYECAPGLRVSIVAIAELPATRETLLLRLMGAGSTLRRAIRELRALGRRSREARIAWPALRSLRLTLQPAADQDDDERGINMEVEETYDEFEEVSMLAGRV